MRKAIMICAIAGATLTFAQPGWGKERFQYAVKFICGQSFEDPLQVVRGIYATAVNVHNPSRRDVGFFKKVAIALPKEEPGPVSRFARALLGRDQALEIDCDDIRGIAGQGLNISLLKGFVVILSEEELDVTAVYTARPSQGEVETIHVQVIQARKLP